MKLNTAIIAFALPSKPAFICGSPDHTLIISDVRFLLVEKDFYAEDILYFTDWKTLKEITNALPTYIFCIGGGVEAAAFLNRNKRTGIITNDKDPLIIFDIIQGIFLRYNQLESNLKTAQTLKAPTRDILNCCSDFFQNHAVLFDTERNLIDYSDHYLPGNDDVIWKETVDTGKRSKTMLAEVKKNNTQEEPIKSPYSELVDLGPSFPRFLTHAFYENRKRLATLMIIEKNKPLSVAHLKLFDYITTLLSTSLFHRYSVSFGFLENLRSVFVSILDNTNVDPLVVRRCLDLGGWTVKDDFRLILINMPDGSRNTETLTRFRHIYERIFPDSVVFQYIDNLVMIVHNDTNEVMTECIPKLERQLILHNAVCGVSLPFNSILQINFHYNDADAAINLGSKNKRVRYLNDVITDHLINRMAADMPLIPLCHREAIRVFDHDLENGTALLLTLETYLRQNKSLKAAAEELFIHRSTMTYRLGCIEKLTTMDLNDSRERLHILLSCIVLRTLETR